VANGRGAHDTLFADFARSVFEDEASVAVEAERIVIGDRS
jgi:hypothetical protein